MKSIHRVRGYEIINLGESRTVSLNELIKLIEKIIGHKVQIQRFNLQPGDVLRTYADISKARRLLDYSPRIDFETGLKYFYEWFTSHK